MSAKARKKPLRFTRNQLGTIYDALQERYEMLKDFGSASRNEQKQVMRLMDKISL